MEFEDGSGRRKPASAEEKAQDASTDRFEKRMENDPAKIQAHATFEKCLRTILKEREIPMSDADISKVMGIRSGAATGVKTYIEGKLAIEDMRRLDTIDNTVDYRMNNGIREIVLPLTGADGTHKARLGLGALGEEFLRRFPLDLLEPAIKEAQEMADKELDPERLEATRIIDNL